MAEFLGEESLPRPQVVKRMWEYIRAHDLQVLPLPKVCPEPHAPTPTPSCSHMGESTSTGRKLLSA
jgi:hypothetical protein